MGTLMYKLLRKIRPKWFVNVLVIHNKNGAPMPEVDIGKINYTKEQTTEVHLGNLNVDPKIQLSDITPNGWLILAHTGENDYKVMKVNWNSRQLSTLSRDDRILIANLIEKTRSRNWGMSSFLAKYGGVIGSFAILALAAVTFIVIAQKFDSLQHIVITAKCASAAVTATPTPPPFG